MGSLAWPVCAAQARLEERWIAAAVRLSCGVWGSVTDAGVDPGRGPGAGCAATFADWDEAVGDHPAGLAAPAGRRGHGQLLSEGRRGRERRGPGDDRLPGHQGGYAERVPGRRGEPARSWIW